MPHFRRATRPGKISALSVTALATVLAGWVALELWQEPRKGRTPTTPDPGHSRTEITRVAFEDDSTGEPRITVELTVVNAEPTNSLILARSRGFLGMRVYIDEKPYSLEWINEPLCAQLIDDDFLPLLRPGNEERFTFTASMEYFRLVRVPNAEESFQRTLRTCAVVSIPAHVVDTDTLGKLEVQQNSVKMDHSLLEQVILNDQVRTVALKSRPTEISGASGLISHARNREEP